MNTPHLLGYVLHMLQVKSETGAGGFSSGDTIPGIYRYTFTNDILYPLGHTRRMPQPCPQRLRRGRESWVRQKRAG